MARRKRQPHNPALAEYQRQQREDEDRRRRDRRTTDLLRNARVVPMEVDDPDPSAAGEKIIVMRSTRNDPLAGLHARNHIDDAQYQGGRSFQRDFETAERGPRAIDFTREAVDGGLMPEPITERQSAAVLRLNRAHRQLGIDGSALVHDVVIYGRSLATVAETRGLPGRNWEDHFLAKLCKHLDTLAELWGFSNGTRSS